MNRRILLSAALAAGFLGASAQINSPEAEGYIMRGKMMYEDANYNGCIDQMLQVRHLGADDTMAEEALYYVAMSTQGLGDDEALPLLQSFLARYPESVHRQQVLMSIGDYYFTRGSYGTAIQRYKLVDPATLDLAASEDYRYRMAYSYMMLTEYNQAEPLFRTLSTSGKYANAAKFYEAYIAYCRADYRKALQLFKSVDTTGEPGNTADYYLAQLYFKNGDYQQALASARRMIAANPVPEYTVESRRIAGESLYNLGNTEDAVPYLWQYVSEANEPQPSAYYILGIEEYNNGDYDAAAKLLQRAIKSNDAMAQNAYLYLGQCYLKNGNRNSALMAFENASRMNYDPKVQETAFYNYAVARSEGGKAPFSSSVAVFEDFLDQYPQSRYADTIREYLVGGYMTDDDYDAALASINRISNPSAEILAAKKRVLFVLGTRDASAGNSSLALERFEQSRAISEGDKSINYQTELWMGDCYYNEGKYAEAARSYLNYLDAAPASDPNRQLAYYNLGYARYNQQKYADALTDFSRAVEAKGSMNKATLADAYCRMGDCCYGLHRFEEAATKYKKAFDLNPSTGDYPLYQQALMKGLSGNHTAEISLLNDMMSRYPSSPLYPAALLAKADSYNSAGNTAKAIDTYKELVRDFPSSSYGRNGMLQLAITFLNNGQRDKAIETYRKVIYTYPTSEEARMASDDLKRIYAEDGNLNAYISFINSVPNAPEIDPSELDAIAFETARDLYLESNNTTQLANYLRQYPNGAFKAQALYFMAEDAEDAGRYNEAYNYATQVIMQYPDADVAESALAIKGSAELHQGKGEIALDTYRKLEQKASSPAMRHNARMAILRVSRDLGRHADVVTTADNLLNSSASSLGPDANEIHFTRAYALNQLGRYDEAETEWTQLAKDPSDLFGAKSAFYLAQSQYDRNLNTKAEKTINAFLDSNSPQDYWRARGVILLSDILRKKGNNFEADEYLRAIKNNYRGNESDIFNMVNERLK